MKIAENLEVLEIKADLANGPGVINLLLIWDEKDVILFDAGLPNMAEIIKITAETSGIPFFRLNKIMITHSDMDHIGSLSRIIKDSGRYIEVFAHEEEKPYIECREPPVRLKQMEESAGKIQGELRQQLTVMTENLKKSYMLFYTKVDRTVYDGEILPFCGGITCIYTPGHTPGHMCYYLNKPKVLIAGDVLEGNDGFLSACPDFTVIDKEALKISLKKLEQFDIKKVVCYHGGILEEEINRRITEIIENIV